MSSQSYVPVNNELSLEPDVENPGLNNSLPLNISIDVENVDIEKQPVIRAEGTCGQRESNNLWW